MRIAFALALAAWATASASAASASACSASVSASATFAGVFADSSVSQFRSPTRGALMTARRPPCPVLP